MEEEKKSNKTYQFIIPVFGIFLIIGLGVLTGYALSKKGKTIGGLGASGIIQSDKEVGSTDTKVFKDTTSGTLEKGGIDGEGTHKLIREGGPSQTAYLTSSVIDLDQFEGKKVQVWGETQKGQKAGWFMDVGRVKIIE